ncbi:hypothetical protein TNCV_2651381 [Trichonephila clavipes]|nr:hypothetical protein TNCV_2651381 [Trichonephila clavipes]
MTGEDHQERRKEMRREKKTKTQRREKNILERSSVCHRNKPVESETEKKIGSDMEKETPNSTTLSKKIAQGNLTASCKRLISWFLLYKATELGRKIVPVRPPKF